MNFIIKNIFFIIIAGFVSHIIAQDCKAAIVIETNTQNPVIVINGNLIENTQTEFELEPGIYNITVKQPATYWNAKSLQKEIIINECNHRKISFNFNDEVYLQTSPEDVGVYSKGSLLGYSPLFISIDSNSLLLEKPGYDSKVISLSDLNTSSPVKLDFIGLVKEKSFFEKDLFKFLVAGIVALGGTTAYFKIKADNKFEEYEFSGDKNLLDQTRTYDMISGISFAALQVNFAALIYFFLID